MLQVTSYCPTRSKVWTCFCCGSVSTLNTAAPRVAPVHGDVVPHVFGVAKLHRLADADVEHARHELLGVLIHHRRSFRHRRLGSGRRERDDGALGRRAVTSAIAVAAGAGAGAAAAGRLARRIRTRRSPRTAGRWRRFSFRSLESNGIHRRQVRRERLPRIAAVFAQPQRPGGRAERQRLAGFIHVERVAEDQVVGVRLRQAARQRLEGLAAVAWSGSRPRARPRDSVSRR